MAAGVQTTEKDAPPGSFPVLITGLMKLDRAGKVFRGRDFLALKSQGPGKVRFFSNIKMP